MTTNLIKTTFTLLVIILAFSRSIAESTSTSNTNKADSLENYFFELVDSNNLHRALEINERLSALRKASGNKTEWLQTQIRKAEILRGLSDLQDAINVIHNAEPILSEIDDDGIKTAFYNRKSAILFEMKLLTDALKAVKMSKNIDAANGSKAWLSSNLTLEGAIYRELGDLTNSLAVLKTSYKYAKAIKDTAEYHLSCYNLALCFQKLLMWDSAIYYARRYINSNSDEATRTMKDDMIHIMAMCNGQLEKYDSAYFYLDLVHERRLHRMQTMVESEAKEAAAITNLAKKEIDNEKLELENNKRRFQVILLLTVSFILFFIIIWTLRQRRNFKSLHAKQEILNKKLSASNSFRTQLIGIVAHDIRNPINGVISIIQLFNSGSVSQEDLVYLMRKLEVSAQNVNLLLENLVNWVKTQDEKFLINTSEINPQVFLNTISKEIHIMVENKEIKLNIETSNIPDIITTDENLLALIVRNLITNSIKFSKKGGEIRIEFKQNNTHHIICIADNGIGISPERLERIKQHTNSSELGTSKEKGTGLGLPLSFEMAKFIGGFIDIKSEEKIGTEVCVHIPKENLN